MGVENLLLEYGSGAGDDGRAYDWRMAGTGACWLEPRDRRLSGGGGCWDELLPTELLDEKDDLLGSALSLSLSLSLCCCWVLGVGDAYLLLTGGGGTLVLGEAYLLGGGALLPMDPSEDMDALSTLMPPLGGAGLEGRGRADGEDGTDGRVFGAGEPCL